METKIYVILMLITFGSIMGCSGTSANIKNQSPDESKITQKKLINDWSDYDILYNYTIIVFDPKNDDKKILVGSHWGTVKDQETWTEIVKNNTTSNGDIDPMRSSFPMTGVREIWAPDSQFYGYVIHQRRDLVNVTVVDDKTVRLFYKYAHAGAP